MTGEKKFVSNKRRKFRISYILIFLFLIVIAVFISFKHNTKKELDKKIKEIHAAGYPVTLEELDEWYSIPDGYENGADIILSASGYYLLDQNDLAILPFIGDRKIESRSEPLPGEVLNQSSQFLAKNKQCFDLLYTLKDYEYCRYPINLNNGYNTMLPHFSDINTIIKLLQLNAIYNSECNNPESVIDSIEAMICVSRSLILEPLNISQLVRLEILSQVYKTLEIVLKKIEFNNEELSQLQELLNESEEFSGIARGIVGERCLTLDALKNILVFDGEVGILLPPVFVLEVYKALGIVNRESRIYLDLQKEYLYILMLPLHERLKASKVLDNKIKNVIEKSLLLESFIDQSDRFSSSRVIESDLQNSAKLINSKAAIAVERYRLKNNKLPDSLSILVPDFLETIPIDLFDGQEIRYKKLGVGYIIYSIGEDMIDDGGKEASNDGRNSTNDITFIVEH